MIFAWVKIIIVWNVNVTFNNVYTCTNFVIDKLYLGTKRVTQPESCLKNSSQNIGGVPVSSYDTVQAGAGGAPVSSYDIVENGRHLMQTGQILLHNGNEKRYFILVNTFPNNSPQLCGA